MADAIDIVLRVQDQASAPMAAAAGAATRLGTAGEAAGRGLGASAGGLRMVATQLPDVVTQLAAGANPMQVLTQQGLQVAQGMMAAGTAMSTVALAVGAVAGAVGLGYVAWRIYSEDASRAAEVSADVTAAHEAMRPILDSTRMALIDLAEATGALSEADADLERNSIRAFGAYQKATTDTRAKLAELRAEQGGVWTQVVDGVQSTLGPIGMAGKAWDALTTSSGELQRHIDAEAGALGAATDAMRTNVEVTAAEIAATHAAAAAKKAEAAATREATQAKREAAEAKSEADKLIKQAEQMTAARFREFEATAAYVDVLMFAGTAEQAAAKSAHELAAMIDTLAPPEVVSQLDMIALAEVRLGAALDAGTISAAHYATEMDRLAAARSKGGAAKTGAALQGAASAISNPIQAIGAAGGPVGSGVVAVLGALSNAEQTTKAVDAFVDGLVNGLPDAVPALVESLAKGAPEIAFALLETLADPQFWIDVVTAFAEGIAAAFGFADTEAAGEGTSGKAREGMDWWDYTPIGGLVDTAFQAAQGISEVGQSLERKTSAGASRMVGRGGKVYLEIDADSVSDSFRQLAGRGYSFGA